MVPMRRPGSITTGRGGIDRSVAGTERFTSGCRRRGVCQRSRLRLVDECRAKAVSVKLEGLVQRLGRHAAAPLSARSREGCKQSVPVVRDAGIVGGQGTAGGHPCSRRFAFLVKGTKMVCTIPLSVIWGAYGWLFRGIEWLAPDQNAGWPQPTDPMHSKFLRLAVSTGLFMLLAACGGGEGRPEVLAGHAIGGTVTGLASGTQLVLNNQGGDPLSVSADGPFAFASPVAHDGSYAITVETQPAGQTCTVSNGAGAGVTADVSDVGVICSTKTYVIGGTVTGLAGEGQVTLQNNGSDPTAVSADGSFSFSTPVAHDGSYAVTVATQPVGQACTVSNGSGAGVTAAVSNVSVELLDQHLRHRRHRHGSERRRAGDADEQRQQSGDRHGRRSLSASPCQWPTTVATRSPWRPSRWARHARSPTVLVPVSPRWSPT